jgi:hypothetical protein
MKSFLYLAIISIVTIPTVVFAQNYLVGIPGVDQGAGNFDDYIQAVYVMFISIAALLAVVKIIIAGLKYMFTDIVTQKGDAKKDIQGAVFGLLIVMSAVLILTVINPDLTGFTFDQDQIGLPEKLSLTGDNVLTVGEAEVIELYCAENDNCVTQSCEFLATDYWITSIINRPINSLTCTAFCRGVVVEDNCLYPADEDAYNDEILSLVSDTFSSGDEIVRIGSGEGVFNTDYINSIVDEQSCRDSFGEVLTNNEDELCVIGLELRISVLPEIASANCPDGRICTAEICDQEARGIFESCEEQCLNNSGSVHYDSNARACVFYDLDRDLGGLSVSYDFNPDNEYYLKQNQDQIAGGETPLQVISVSPSTSGNPAFVNAVLGNGETIEIVCNIIEPSVCLFE